MLKPATDVVEAEWLGAVLGAIRADGFRLARPVASSCGSWTVEGWSASSWVDGHHDVADRWSEVLAAGQAFHDAVRGVARPDFLDNRSSPWAHGDRVAWGEAEPVIRHEPLRGVVERLLDHVIPHRLPSQLVHGDLAGNVMLSDVAGVSPAVIDMAPYWRPAEFGAAVVVADAIAWHGADLDLARSLRADVDRRSMLARAAIFRLVTADRFATATTTTRTGYVDDEASAYARVLSVLPWL